MLHVPSSQASYLPSPVFCQAMHHSRAGIITGGMSRVAGEERSGSVSNMSAGPLPLLKGGDEHSGHLRTKPESTPRPFYHDPFLNESNEAENTVFLAQRNVQSLQVASPFDLS
ncbi:hypothetical protein Vi05172_g7975 [Venturia inaequalis]|nr:hypothetical protein Vi05172_g7975 [Venturia inaequalis]